MPRDYDKQRQKVYKFEWSNVDPGQEAIDLDEARKLVNNAWKRYGSGPAPRVDVLPKGRATSWYKRDNTIHLAPLRDRDDVKFNRAVVLHEVAHGLCYKGAFRRHADWGNNEWHGELFVALSWQLYEKYGVVKVAELRKANRALPRGQRVKLLPTSKFTLSANRDRNRPATAYKYPKATPKPPAKPRKKRKTVKCLDCERRVAATKKTKRCGDCWERHVDAIIDGRPRATLYVSPTTGETDAVATCTECHSRYSLANWDNDEHCWDCHPDVRTTTTGATPKTTCNECGAAQRHPAWGICWDCMRTGTEATR